MNRLYKGFLGLIGGLSLGYAVTTTAVKAESNGGNFPNGVDVLSVAGEDKSMSAEVLDSIDKRIKEKGFLKGTIEGIFSLPIRLVYNTLMTPRIIVQPVQTVKETIEYAVNNPVETVAEGGAGYIIGHSIGKSGNSGSPTGTGPGR